MAKPLFRWAGGKTRMLKHHTPLITLNAIDTYCEPFFGAGAMYIYVQNTFKPKKCIINDIYEGTTNVFKAIKNNLKEFLFYLDKLDEKYISLDYSDRKIFYYNIRHHHAYSQLGDIERASLQYFLLKTCFNGLFVTRKITNNKYGTPFGNGDQKKSVYCLKTIIYWHNMLQNTTILTGNYDSVKASRFDFIYADPPYIDCSVKYASNWSYEDCDKTLNWLFDQQAKQFIFCNKDDGSKYFRDNYSQLGYHEFPITYTAGRRKQTKDGPKAKKAIEICLVS